MANEIERKWLCHRFPRDLPEIAEILVFQSYLFCGENSEIGIICRQNQINGEIKYRIDIKFGNGLKRKGFEFNINKKTYLFFYSRLKKSPIIKRYKVYQLHDHILKVSLVDSGWMYAEVEFASTREAYPFERPFSDWKEVTEDPYFSMKNYWKRKI